MEFTDEEGYGHDLDLHECYLNYINQMASEKLDCITYLVNLTSYLTFLKEERLQSIRDTWRRFWSTSIIAQKGRNPFGDINLLFGKIKTDPENFGIMVPLKDG